jgi:hypothetical protein
LCGGCGGETTVIGYEASEQLEQSGFNDPQKRMDIIANSFF